jgi:hypothetical protein
VVLPPRSRDESQTTRDHSRAEPATAPASWSCNGNPWQIALLGWNSATGLGVDAAKLATVAHERAKVLYGAGGFDVIAPTAGRFLTGPTISMIVSSDMAWSDSSTCFLQ